MRFVLTIMMLLLGADLAAGQAAGVFARMGFGARGIAMGNALVADGSGEASPYYNPALAPFVSSQSLSLSAALMRLDRELQFIQLATPLEPRAGIAAGLIHAGVNNIDGRDNSGFHTQTYATDEFAAFVAFGVQLGQWMSGGIALQLFRADLFTDLQAVNSIGVDVGLTLQMTEALRLGLALDDLLARYSWDTSGLYSDGGKSTSDRFPLRVRVGASYALLDGKALLLAEYETRVTSAEARTRSVELLGDLPREVLTTERLRLHSSRLRLGGAYRLSDIFEARLGFDQIGADGVKGMKPSAGFMVEQPLGQLRLRAEYAFVLEPYAVGDFHLLTLRLFL